ncbi:MULTISPECIES: hypothetical protein [Hyphomonas]|uniref:hypothetical protein n=1 Tax=Hyphomonas TaxID=85 RepID=UPI000C59C526|nr:MULTISPECIES: hypothetical protein [Hyphomonas]MBB40977.1 hypothetical protein [Hyphomonas sp.]|tara:strand:+ start:3138 stop:3329 length:192 start_codon:yes stop_codon:yes gene_type:complete
MTVSADTMEALQAVSAAWRRCQDLCEHRNKTRDAEGQGPICEHEDNHSGMEWCSPESCPLLAI